MALVFLSGFANAVTGILEIKLKGGHTAQYAISWRSLCEEKKNKNAAVIAGYKGWTPSPRGLGTAPRFRTPASALLSSLTTHPGFVVLLRGAFAPRDFLIITIVRSPSAAKHVSSLAR